MIPYSSRDNDVMFFTCDDIMLLGDDIMLTAELSGGLKESFSSTLEELNGTLQRQKDRISELTSDLGRLQRENEEFVESSIDLQMQVQKATSSRDTLQSS